MPEPCGTGLSHGRGCLNVATKLPAWPGLKSHLRALDWRGRGRTRKGQHLTGSEHLKVSVTQAVASIVQRIRTLKQNMMELSSCLQKLLFQARAISKLSTIADSGVDDRCLISVQKEGKQTLWEEGGLRWAHWDGPGPDASPSRQASQEDTGQGPRGGQAGESGCLAQSP